MFTSMYSTTKRWLVLSLVIGLILVLALSGIAYAQNNNTTYYACINNSSGTIRVYMQATTCNNNETAIMFNQTGPAGPQGPAGEDGAPGPAGSPGPGLQKERIYQVNDSVAIPVDGGGGLQLTCGDDNDVLLSGGFQSGGNVTVINSMPMLDPFEGYIGWFVSGKNESPHGAMLTAYVLCYRVDGP